MVNIHQGPRKQAFNPRSSHTKTPKRYLMPPSLTLSFIRYVSMVKGAIHGKGSRPPQQLGVAAFEKEAFGSASTTVGQLFNFFIWFHVFLSKQTFYVVILGFTF